MGASAASKGSISPAVQLRRGNNCSLCSLSFLSGAPFASREGKALSELPIILIVEDDAPIQGIVEDSLAEGGFQSAIAASGEEAVTLLKSGTANYRGLVTDINLKGRMDGWEVARHARGLDPAFPVVYMSGAAADQWASNGVPNSIMLEKPFAPAQLVTAVSQLLNIGGPSPT
jgi:DNA-binding response OmpR family regulator